ncbi:hypothetical protein HMPREF9306_00612 [Propionimicrobium lymphophilum ACS-093-V-SCH5]|uniref:50S ribosomal protein L4 n=1 Tax=Propionimicrobium lymphophilum ACS-093-V-SCH5 TaxID=883161 RepID=S2VZY7_9ACTN|nr:DUF5324 family protein [Propionimicrobium lymphophilum]EPD33083.1 hypothetical protein HMPREF9306_00612 [Propionimicrobium lymphophilum ACS-093-V-SCH5]
MFNERKAARKAKAAAEEAAANTKHALDDVADFIAPHAKKAANAASETFDDVSRAYKKNVAPAVDKAVSKVQPAVSNAYHDVAKAVDKEVVPRIQKAWKQAQLNPTVQEATDRGAAAVAALRGDLSLPKPVLPEPRKRRSLVRGTFIFVSIAAAVAGVVWFVRSFLGDSDDGWTPQEPNRNFKDSDWNKPAEESEDEKPKRSEEEGKNEKNKYGDDAYVGDEPPAEFTIKGNERSMKYHVPGTGGFEATNADVWFKSEEAAKAAGFTKAQR